MLSQFKLLGIGLTLTTTLLSGCGGGSSSESTPATTTISGSAVKGPVNGATVKALAANTGAVLATTTTNSTGAYTFNISYNGDVVIEVEGGTYTDEATGLPTSLNQLKAIISPTGGTQTVHVTPLTYIAYGYAGNTSTGFNTALTNLTTQFGLGSTNLLSTLPDVSSTANDYGRVLRAMSQYVKNQNLTNFEAFIGQTLTPATFTSLQANFATAFNAINTTGPALTFAFNGAGITVGGTGAGGGSGTCGVNAAGSVNTNGFTVPLNLNYCISGIAAGSCSASNTSLNQSLSGQGGVAGAVNLNYTYSASCAAGAIAINLTP